MKKSPDNQLFFNFEIPEELPVPVPEPIAAEPEPAVEEIPADAIAETPCGEAEETAPQTPEVLEVRSSKFQLVQAVLAHLVRQGAMGAALQVPCRQRKFVADVAGYFSCYSKRFNQLESTVLVEVYSRRSECIPECAGRTAVMEELDLLKEQRAALEEVIRREEPELRVNDELFEEIRSFDYTRSSNSEYHKVCKRIRSLEQSLYRGTPMELLAKANVSDYMIAAVPENMISLREVPDSWGLWYIREDKSVYEVKEPVRQECTAASRHHLVQNIGHCALSSVLFAHGVKVRADGKVRFTRQPKARRK